jgi:acetyl-CoA acetyltransferase
LSEHSKRAAIVGVGHTEFARQIDKSLTRLYVEAARKAIDNAGLLMHQVDGLLTWNGGPNPRYHLELAETFGLYDKQLCMTVKQGGAAAGLCVEIARWALESGRCKYVLIVAGSKEGSAGRSERGHAATDAMATLTMHYPNYEHPYGPLMASFYALIAQRHMHDYGTTTEQLASVSVAMRHNAGLNPDAVYRKPITVDDVLNSKMISTPLHMLQCSIINDGALALVMTTADRARDLDQAPVYVTGMGAGMAGYWTGFLAKGGAEQGYSLTRSLSERAAGDAFREAGVDRTDINFVTMTDSFAINPIVALEDYGFCKKGEGGPFVGDGSRIQVGGELPVQPHGGLLSCNHAGTSYHSFVEAVVQLRGEAGARQVKNAELAFVGNSAGIFSTHYACILSRS